MWGMLLGMLLLIPRRCLIFLVIVVIILVGNFFTADAQAPPPAPAGIVIEEAVAYSGGAQDVFLIRYSLTADAAYQPSVGFYVSVKVDGSEVGGSRIVPYSRPADATPSMATVDPIGYAGVAEVTLTRSVTELVASEDEGDFSVALVAYPNYFATTPATVESNAIVFYTSTDALAQAFLVIVNSLAQIWDVDLIDGDRFNDAGTEYFSSSAPSITALTELAGIREIARAMLEEHDPPPSFLGSDGLVGNWEVDEAFEELASSTGIPVGLMTMLVFFVLAGSAAYALRGQFGAQGGIAAGAFLGTTGLVLGIAGGFIPFLYAAPIIFLVGLVAVLFAAKKVAG